MVVHWLVLPALTPNCTHLVPLIEQVFFGFHLLSCECVQSFLSNLGQLIIFFDLRRWDFLSHTKLFDWFDEWIVVLGIAPESAATFIIWTMTLMIIPSEKVRLILFLVLTFTRLDILNFLKANLDGICLASTLGEKHLFLLSILKPIELASIFVIFYIYMSLYIILHRMRDSLIVKGVSWYFDSLGPPLRCIKIRQSRVAEGNDWFWSILDGADWFLTHFFLSSGISKFDSLILIFEELVFLAFVMEIRILRLFY